MKLGDSLSTGQRLTRFFFEAWKFISSSCYFLMSLFGRTDIFLMYFSQLVLDIFFHQIVATSAYFITALQYIKKMCTINEISSLGRKIF